MKKLIASLLIITAICLSIFGGYKIYEKNAYPLEYADLIVKYSRINGVSASLMAGLINTESSFKTNAISQAGAIGLMQLTPNTAYWLADKLDMHSFSLENLYEPDTNIRLGIYYYSYLYQKFGNTKTALASYNAGEGNVKLWLKNLSYSVDGITLKNVPYKETREHSTRVLRAQKVYKKNYKLE